VLGIRTNIPFLLRILESDEFRSGAVHTGFLDNEGASLRQAEPVDLPPAVDAVIAFHQQSRRTASAAATAVRASDPFETVRGWGVR
jgi:acetyl/propionyl-CoA carboxylase alpha subunit